MRSKTIKRYAAILTTEVHNDNPYIAIFDTPGPWDAFVEIGEVSIFVEWDKAKLIPDAIEALDNHKESLAKEYLSKVRAIEDEKQKLLCLTCEEVPPVQTNEEFENDIPF